MGRWGGIKPKLIAVFVGVLDSGILMVGFLWIITDYRGKVCFLY
jgi:hypothetical protein